MTESRVARKNAFSKGRAIYIGFVLSKGLSNMLLKKASAGINSRLRACFLGEEANFCRNHFLFNRMLLFDGTSDNTYWKFLTQQVYSGCIMYKYGPCSRAHQIKAAG